MKNIKELENGNAITDSLSKWSNDTKEIYSANWKGFNSKMKAIANGDKYKNIKVDKKSAVLQATFLPLAPAILTFHAINIHKDTIKTNASNALKKIQDFPGEVSERVKKGIFKGLKTDEKQKILRNEVERMGKNLGVDSGEYQNKIGKAIGTGNIKNLEDLYYEYKKKTFEKLSVDAMKKKLMRIHRKSGLTHAEAKILVKNADKDTLIKQYNKHIKEEGKKNFKYETIPAHRIVKGIVEVFQRKIQKKLPSRKQVLKTLKTAGMVALKGAAITGVAAASVVMAPFAIAGGVATVATLTAAAVATTPIRLALLGALGIGAAGYFAGKGMVKAFKQDSLLMNHFNHILNFAKAVGTEVFALAKKAFKAVGRAVVKGAKAVGGAVVKGAKAVGGAVVKVAKFFAKGAKALALRVKQAAFDLKEIGNSLIEISGKTVKNMLETGKIVAKAYANTVKQQKDIPIAPVIQAIGSKIADDFKDGIAKIKASFKSIKQTGLLNAIRNFKPELNLQKKLDTRLAGLVEDINMKQEYRGLEGLSSLKAYREHMKSDIQQGLKKYIVKKDVKEASEKRKARRPKKKVMRKK